MNDYVLRVIEIVNQMKLNGENISDDKGQLAKQDNPSYKIGKY